MSGPSDAQRERLRRAMAEAQARMSPAEREAVGIRLERMRRQLNPLPWYARLFQILLRWRSPKRSAPEG